MRVTTRHKPPTTIPIGSGSFLSRTLLFPVFSLIRFCKRYNLNADHIDLARDLSARAFADRLDTLIRAEFDGRTKTPSTRKVIQAVFGRRYATVAISRILTIALTYIGAYYLLKQFLAYIGEPTPVGASGLTPYVLAHIHAAALFIAAILASIMLQVMSMRATKIGVQVRSALMVMAYRKSLRLRQVQTSIADVVNLLADDCNRIADATVHRHYLWSATVEILVVLALAFIELGIGALPALAILVIFLPLQYRLGQLASRYATRASQHTYDRVHRMSEILTAMKLIKFFAWEVFFRDRNNEIRKDELREIRKGLLVKVWSYLIVLGTPVLATLGCLILSRFAMQEQNAIQAIHVFTVLSLFNALRFPFLMLPIALKSFLASPAAYRHFDEFFSQTDIEPPSPMAPPSDDPKLRVEMENADFEWENAVKPAVSFLTLKARAGEVVAVVGDVGAGKTSLLAALLGEIKRTAGIGRVYGSLAYVPSDPWLINSTVKDNVVFGHLFDNRRYAAVVKAARLDKDLEALSRGDDTEIGERGIILSAGQRQRVSIARAAYSTADIILMDDPLSSMDAQTGKHVFHDCIKGFLKDRLVILATNQLTMLEHVDQIIVMKNGTCFEHGTYAELIAKDVNFANLIGESVAIEDPYVVDDLVNEIDFRPIPMEKQREDISSIFDEADHDPDEMELAELDGVDSYQNTSTQEASNNGTSPNQAVITFGDTPKPKRGTSTGNVEANQATISRIQALNAHTSQNLNINEFTLSRFIETRQMSVIDGRNPYHTMNQDTRMARAIERHQLTIHSLHGDDSNTPAVPGTVSVSRRSKKVPMRKIYRVYLRRSTGFWVALVIIFLFILVHAIRIVSDFWLKFYVDDNADDALMYQHIDYMAIYGALVAAFVIGMAVRGYLFAWAAIQKSISFHKRVFIKILRAPMSYFEETPIARILNTFARHQFMLDEALTDAAFQVLQFIPLVVGASLAIIIVMPYAAIVLIILAAFCSLCVYYSRLAENQLRRLEAESKPPIFAHLSCTLEGLYSVRSFGAEGRFDAKNMDKLDRNNKALFAGFQVKAWLNLYVDILVCVFLYAVALLLLFAHSSEGVKSAAGLALTNAMQLLIVLPWTIGSARDVHDAMKSVREFLKYADEVPSEAPVIIKDHRPPPNWPAAGEIEFKDAVLRYHSYGIAVLKQISFRILPREKIGIVGRTGSGKSTLLVSMLRLVELSEGTIVIDGVDIASIGLQDLRRRIAVLPQEPVLFHGTIRSNLDPFNLRTDEEIWHALKSVHLAEKVRNMSLQLESAIIENGRGFTLGQRQLFCIARAILSRCKVLLLDEGATLVDVQTDVLIQETIRKNFVDCTVLKIAHRLNNIVDSDRVLVLDHGRIIEFDTPAKLMQNKNGLFYSLVSKSGDEAARKLKERIRAIHGPFEETSESNTDEQSMSKDKAASRATPKSDIPQSLGRVFDVANDTQETTSESKKSSQEM